MANDPINLYDYEARAKLALPHDNWDFMDAGAMDEITTKRNRSAFDSSSIHEKRGGTQNCDHDARNRHQHAGICLPRR